jgi:hypothetical protein
LRKTKLNLNLVLDPKLSETLSLPVNSSTQTKIVLSLTFAMLVSEDKRKTLQVKKKSGEKFSIFFSIIDDCGHFLLNICFVYLFHFVLW